ncbi:hypothetical protein DdX_18861 [Ditylenchus destructor]|uniref:Uncharacterized protein n=1 Tax=Ditylenchus destructor TaxID=166010 RepID=A0AAD4MNP6_9BILA|nr:hypothetical protein DdX_18861 [Ditylenchus destructor]
MSEFKAETFSESSQTRTYGLDESDDQLDSEGEQKFTDRSESLEPLEVIDNHKNYIALSEKLRASDARNLQLLTEIRQISSKYQTSIEELKIAQERIRKLETKVQEKQTPMAQLMAILEETTQKVKSEEISMLENLLKSAQAEAEKMKSEIKNKDAEAEKMAAENETLKQKIERSLEDLAASKKRCRETNASLRQFRKSLETANREKERMTEQFVKTRKEQGSRLTAYSTFFEKYKTEMRSKDAELETCKKRLDLTLRSFGAKDQKCTEFAADLKKCKSDFEDLKKRHSELSQENATLKVQNATLKDQNNSSVSKICEMEQKLAEFNAKIDEFDAEKKQEVERRESLVKELQTELEKCRQEAKEAVSARSHAYRTLTDLLPQLAPSDQEKQRFSVPEPQFISPAPPEARKRPLPSAQFEPQPILYFAKRPCADNIPDLEEKRRRRAKTVINEHAYCRI